MTTVKVQENGGRITINITGHAGFSDSNDIVCAAVSALSYTLMQRIQDMDNFNAFDRMCCDFKDGAVHVDAIPHKAYEEELYTTVRTILTGFELLNNRYPNNVFLDFTGGRSFER